MKKIAIFFTVIFFSLLMVALPQETVNNNEQSAPVVNSKKENKKAKKEYKKSKKEFFDNFYNPVLYEDVDKVIIKDTVIRTTFYVYDITTDDYLFDEHLTISEKEGIRSMANALNRYKIRFDKNSSLMQLEHTEFIVEVAKILQQSPTLNLMIEGYTCDIDTDKQNRDLAVRRAAAVSNLFVQKGIPASRLKVVGFTADEPVSVPDASNLVRFKIFR